MTTLNTVTGQPTPAAGSSGSPASPSNPGAQAGTNTFLQLLIAEMRTQDPLNPTGGAEFVTQLAQFNSLEQLIAIREEIGALQAGGARASANASSGLQPLLPS
jgi:flagellar basal-body rod modification protein FlgD